MPACQELTICDLPQSYPPSGGGGISTYLRRQRDHVLDHIPHRHRFAPAGRRRAERALPPAAELRVREVVSTAHPPADLTLDLGTVGHDHLSPGHD